MPPTTTTLSLCQSREISRSVKSGLLPSIKWSRFSHAVIAGHKRVGNDDSPRIIVETRKYIRDFERLAMQTMTARELYDEMLKLYPDWINRGALWSSVLAAKTSV